MTDAELLALHRDVHGNGLLVGPDCPDCERVAVAHYRCAICDERFAVPGRFRWSWQGKGHWHNPDNDDEWRAMIFDHRNTHGGHGVILPVREEA